MKGIVGVLLLALLGFGMWASSVYAQEGEELFVEKRRVSRGEATTLSALFPGLGQISSGHRMKGTVFFVSEVVSLAVAVHAHESHRTKDSQFDQMKEEYEQMRVGGNYADSEAKWKEMEDIKGDLEGLRKLRSAFVAASAGVYLVNLMDALFFSSYEISETASKVDIRAQMIQGAPGLVVAASW